MTELVLSSNYEFLKRFTSVVWIDTRLVLLLRRGRELCRGRRAECMQGLCCALSAGGRDEMAAGPSPGASRRPPCGCGTPRGAAGWGWCGAGSAGAVGGGQRYRVLGNSGKRRKTFLREVNVRNPFSSVLQGKNHVFGITLCFRLFLIAIPACWHGKERTEPELCALGSTATATDWILGLKQTNHKAFCVASQENGGVCVSPSARRAAHDFWGQTRCLAQSPLQLAETFSAISTDSGCRFWGVF